MRCYRFENIEKIILHVNVALRWLFTFFCLFHFISHFLWKIKNFLSNSFFKKALLTSKFINNCFQFYQTIFQFTYSYQYQWHDLNQQELLRSMLRRVQSQVRLLENSSNSVNLIRNSEKKRRYRSKSKWYLHIINCNANILSIAMRTYHRLQCEHIIDCNANILSIAMWTYYRLQCEHIIDCNANMLSINCCASRNTQISKKRKTTYFKIFISTICPKTPS